MKTYLKVGGGLAKFLAEAVHVLHIAFALEATRWKQKGLYEGLTGRHSLLLDYSPRMDACILMRQGYVA